MAIQSLKHVHIIRLHPLARRIKRLNKKKNMILNEIPKISLHLHKCFIDVIDVF